MSLDINRLSCTRDGSCILNFHEIVICYIYALFILKNVYKINMAMVFYTRDQ